MCLKRDDLDKQILQCRSELSKICPVVLVNPIRAKIQELNATLFKHLNQIKTLKLEHLIGPKISSHATFYSQNTVVTIPENLPLTDSEKSVHLRWYIVSHQRDVFPGYRNSGPHCSSGHYLTLEKLPSGDSLYTT